MTRKDYVATAEILNGFKDLIGDQLLFEDLVDAEWMRLQSMRPPQYMAPQQQPQQAPAQTFRQPYPPQYPPQ